MKSQPYHNKQRLCPTIGRKEGKQTGLTLIEVLIALLLVSIGLLGIAGLQTRAIGSNRAARMQTEATALAAAMLEQMRLLPYDHPNLTPGSARQRLTVFNSGTYTAQWTITDDLPVSGTKTIRIRVSWSGAAYNSVVRLHTIIARYRPR